MGQLLHILVCGIYYRAFLVVWSASLQNDLLCEDPTILVNVSEAGRIWHVVIRVIKP